MKCTKKMQMISWNADEQYEGHVDHDDDSAYPMTQESVVIKHNSDTSDSCRKCRT